MNTFEEETNLTSVEEKKEIEVIPQVQKEKDCHKRMLSQIFRIVLDLFMIIAIIVLFLLYFFFPREKATPKPTYTGLPGTGEIVYINIDTINENYDLVDILTKDIETEQAKQEAIFANRQKALENKYNQFQKNYQANILTPAQIQNTQEQLTKENTILQQEYEKVSSDLQTRHIAALQQIADSLMSAAKRINAGRNASFIFTYQYGGQLIVADPTKDITKEVLEELNKPYKK
jgi:Skp family chaperone for outer membrane proteins